MRLYTKVIILSLMLSIMPLVLMAGVFLYNAQKELTSEIDQRLSAVSVLKKNSLETFFASRKEDLHAVQGFLDIQINLPTLQLFDRDRYNFAYQKAAMQLNDQLRDFINSYQYADVMLLDTKGKVVFVTNSSHWGDNMNKKLFNADQLSLARDDVYISDPVAINDEEHPYVLYMTTVARDIQKQFVGYIVLEVDMKLVYALISNNTGIGNTGETFLTKKIPDNQFLVISPLLHDAQAILRRTIGTESKSGMTVKNDIREGMDYRGKDVLALWQHLPLLNWELVTKIDKQEVFAPIRSIQFLFLSIFALVLLVIVLSSVVFAESIADPIHQLQKGAELIGQGDLDYKVGVSSSDEIGQLSRAFDNMVQNLKKTMASRDELEKEVIKRQEAEEQLKIFAKELHDMSVHDPLTGVLNRRGLQDVLSKTLPMSQRMGISVQVLLLDFDNFKQINDGHGYGIGDAILVAGTEKMKQTVRQTDYIARVGGDEFMILLLDNREADAMKVAEKIRLAVSRAFVTTRTGEVIKATCSMGIIPLEDHNSAIDTLLQKLHASLRVSKKLGKNRISYQESQGEIELKSHEEEGEFKKVLVSGDRFYAASQPIFNLKEMRIIGYEFLSRLDYEGGVSPDIFLPFARNADLLGVVDYACFKSCLRALKDSPITKIAFLNIFPSTLVEMSVDHLLKEFQSTGKDIKFCLEINEQQILGDPLYLIPAITKLKLAGVMIALDDYGFGRSSVETLVLLEPDIVKIDKRIIQDIAQDERKLNNLKRLLRVIESCKASVIAEGVETNEDLALLLKLGVNAGQGFLMGKPEIPPNLT